MGDHTDLQTGLVRIVVDIETRPSSKPAPQTSSHPHEHIVSAKARLKVCDNQLENETSISILSLLQGRNILFVPNEIILRPIAPSVARYTRHKRTSGHSADILSVRLRGFSTQRFVSAVQAAHAPHITQCGERLGTPYELDHAEFVLSSDESARLWSVSGIELAVLDPYTRMFKLTGDRLEPWSAISFRAQSSRSGCAASLSYQTEGETENHPSMIHLGLALPLET